MCILGEEVLDKDGGTEAISGSIREESYTGFLCSDDSQSLFSRRCVRIDKFTAQKKGLISLKHLR
jgi:hypothetical protein